MRSAWVVWQSWSLKVSAGSPSLPQRDSHLQRLPTPGLSAPQDWELWRDDFGSDYFCILLIFFFIVCNGFILPLLSTPTASFMSGRKSPHTWASLSGLRKSHLCGGIVSSVLFLVSFWTTFQQSGPRRNLGVTRQGDFLPSDKHRRLNPRKGQSAAAKACSFHRTSREWIDCLAPFLGYHTTH